MLGRLLISFDCDFRFPQYPQGPFWTLHHQLLQDELTPVYGYKCNGTNWDFSCYMNPDISVLFYLFFLQNSTLTLFCIRKRPGKSGRMAMLSERRGHYTYFFHYFFSGNSESNIQSWHLVSNRCSCSCHYAIRPIRVKETWFTRCLSSSWCHYLGF